MAEFLPPIHTCIYLHVHKYTHPNMHTYICICGRFPYVWLIRRLDNCPPQYHCDCVSDREGRRTPSPMGRQYLYICIAYLIKRPLSKDTLCRRAAGGFWRSSIFQMEYESKRFNYSDNHDPKLALDELENDLYLSKNIF